MPKDNDSIINDILKDTENQKKEKTESEIPQTDDAEKEENFIEKSFKASEFKLRSAETVGDFEEASENSGLNDENVSAESDEKNIITDSPVCLSLQLLFLR